MMKKKEQRMNTRCRSGDIVLVIHDETGCVANVGHVVEVRGPVWIDPELELPCWLIKPVHRHPWKVLESDGSIVTEFVHWKSRVRHPDNWLLPLRQKLLDSVHWEIQESSNLWFVTPMPSAVL